MSSFRFWRKLTYKKRLFVYSLLLSIVPVLLVGFVSSWMSAKTIQEEVDHNQQMTLQQLKYQVDTFLYNIERTSVQIAGDITIEKSMKVGISMDDPVKLQTLLDMQDRMNLYRGHSDIRFDASLVYYKYGYVYSNRHGIVDMKDFPYYPYLQTLPSLPERSLVVPPKTYRDQQDLLLIRPIQSSAAPPEGLLVMEVDAKKFYDFFQSLKMSNNSRMIIVDDEGRVVMSQDEAEIGSQLNSLSELNQLRLNGEEPPKRIIVGETDYRVSVQKSAINEWTYIALTPHKALTEKSNGIIQLTWVVVAFLVGLWIMISIVASNRLYFPLHHLALKLPRTAPYKDVLQAIDGYIDDSLAANRRLTDEINNRLPNLKEFLLLQLLRGEISEREFAEQSGRYGFPLSGRYFCVFVVKVDQYMAFKQNYVGKDRSLMMYALSKLIQEMCEQVSPCVTAVPEPGLIAVLFGSEEGGKEAEGALSGICDAIRAHVSQYFHFTVTASFSQPRRELKQICDGYQEALDLLHVSFWLGSNRTISYRDLDDLGPVAQTSRLLVKMQKAIVRSIAEGDLAKAEEQLHAMMAAVPQTEAYSLPAVGMFAHLIGEVDGLLEEMGSDLTGMFDGNLYMRVYSAESLAELEDWFRSEFFPTLRGHLGQLDGSQKHGLIRQAIEYIHENYETDLSLQQAAAQLRLSPYQLSRFFKEETGMTFFDYVIDYRISKAKEWLIYTEMSIKEITERLRYASTQNFTRVFKQMTGVPPGKYRSDWRQSGG